MTAPRLFRTILPVADLEQAAAFYARLLDDPGRRVAPTRHYFDCGDVILACVQPFDHALNAVAPPAAFRPNPDHVYFAVADLEAWHERARQAGARHVDTTIERQPWGERSFYLRDPFDNPLCFVDDATLFTGRPAEA